MGLTVLSLSLLVLLAILLIIISCIDYYYMQVNDLWMWAILSISVPLFIDLTESYNILIKFIMLISIALIVYYACAIGTKLFEQGIYGGADIKLIMSLSPLIAYMGIIGWLFITWMFIINPYAVKSFNKYESKKSILTGILNIRRFAFIPVISFVFLVNISLVLFMS